MYGKRYVKAEDLEAGDELFVLEKGIGELETKEIEEVNIILLEERTPVFNFEVENWNSYFVGEVGVLVHNYPLKNNTPIKAADLSTIRKNSKEWNTAVADIKRGGNTNFRVETATDAKSLLKESRGNMNRYKQYTSDYKKGYEVHPNEKNSVNAPHNNLPHIKWKDWIGGETSGKGHIFFNKPN